MFSPLIYKAKSSPQAFAKLYSLHFDATYKYLLLRCKTKADAEDLTSQVWESVLKNIAKFDSNHPLVFKAWLFKIVKNTFYKYLQVSSKSAVTLGQDEPMDVIASNEKTPSELIGLQDETSQVKRLIDVLPEQQREIVLMHFSADLKNKEIARILDIKEKTVASNLSRALQTLRKNYEKLQ